MVRIKNLLYREGITCSSMGVTFGACRLPPNATFGVNANIVCGQEDSWWLLAYLNSSLVSYIVRGVLIRSNMITSGYVSRIPLISLSSNQKEALGALARVAYSISQAGGSITETMNSIDSVVFDAAGINESTTTMIRQFCGDIVRLT
jgi:hypothetical protein